MPFFSVIIPTYNRHSLTKRAIESVLNQSHTDYEILVIDDGSTDTTPQLEKEFKSRIHYVRQNNRGVSAARNRGIQLSRSAYCAFLDSDDQWRHKKLESHAAYIHENPQILLHQCEEIWIRHGKRVNPWKKHLKREGYIFIDSLELCLISPSSVVAHKDLFQKYGTFDENLPACEDYDLWLRITPFERVGLIHEKLNIRYAGHQDQLSSIFWGMDRFRLYSIIKLLSNNESLLNTENREAAQRMADKKIHILMNGAIKRGKLDFAEKLSAISEQLKNECYSSIDLTTLLQQ